MARLIFAVIAAAIAFSPNVAVAADDEATVAATPPVKQLSAREKREDSLDRLFAELRRGGEGDAPRIETRIWQIWANSDSPTAEALLGQASLAMARKEIDPSLEILDEVISAYPDFAEAWSRRATLFFMKGDYGKALADVDKALEIEPRHFGALAGKGLILQRQGKYGAAAEAYKAALAVNPNMTAAKEALKALERLEAPL
jgi:tetratricopeptide (TPR) repeat protein